jgi:hypothetical protein
MIKRHRSFAASGCANHTSFACPEPEPSVFERRGLRAIFVAALLTVSVSRPGAQTSPFVEGPASPLLAGGTVASGSQSKPWSGEPTLEEVRRLTERFKDVTVALAEGFIRDPGNHCETATMMGRPAAAGAMGIHYFRPDLLGITAPPSPRVDGNGIHTDFRKPSILIYEPQADGSLQLVAVENLVFAAAWRAAGHTQPPTFHGMPWDSMVDDPTTELDEAHMFAPHFDRHVWIHRDNPNGVFAQFNPTVSCAHHAHTGH